MICNLLTIDSTPFFAADAQMLIKDPTGILNRWAEHFNSVLNRVSTISDEAIDQLPQRPIHDELDDALTVAETIKAVKQLSSGKAAGTDGIPAVLASKLQSNSRSCLMLSG